MQLVATKNKRRKRKKAAKDHVEIAGSKSSLFFVVLKLWHLYYSRSRSKLLSLRHQNKECSGANQHMRFEKMGHPRRYISI